MDEHPDDNAELIVDQILRFDQSFDDSIAKIDAICRSNNPTAGFDVEVSIHLGSGTVPINIGNEIEAKVEIGIREAEVVFDSAYVNLIETYKIDPSAGNFEAGQQKIQTEIAKRSSASGGASASVNLAKPVLEYFHAQGKLEGARSSKSHTQQCATSTTRQVYQVGNKLYIRNSQFNESFLSGNLLHQAKCARFKPRGANRRCGVIARLQVKLDWISIDLLKKGSRIRRRVGNLANLITSQFNEEDPKQIAFDLLLKHLIKLRLQNPDVKNYATLAASAVILSPTREEYQTASTRSTPSPLSLPAEPFHEIMQAPAEKLGEILLRNGLSPDQLPLELAPPVPSSSAESVDETEVKRTYVAVPERYPDLSLPDANYERNSLFDSYAKRCERYLDFEDRIGEKEDSHKLSVDKIRDRLAVLAWDRKGSRAVKSIRLSQAASRRISHLIRILDGKYPRNVRFSGSVEFELLSKLYPELEIQNRHSRVFFEGDPALIHFAFVEICDFLASGDYFGTLVFDGMNYGHLGISHKPKLITRSKSDYSAERILTNFNSYFSVSSSYEKFLERWGTDTGLKEVIVRRPQFVIDWLQTKEGSGGA